MDLANYKSVGYEYETYQKISGGKKSRKKIAVVAVGRTLLVLLGQAAPANGVAGVSTASDSDRIKLSDKS